MATASAWARPGIGIRIRIEVADADEELGRGSHLSQSTLRSSPLPHTPRGDRAKNLCSRWDRVASAATVAYRRKEKGVGREESRVQTEVVILSLPLSHIHTHAHTQPREKEFLLIKCVIIAQKYTPTTTRKVSRVRRVSHVTRHEYFVIKLNSRDRAADLS